MVTFQRVTSENAARTHVFNVPLEKQQQIVWVMQHSRCSSRTIWALYSRWGFLIGNLTQNDQRPYAALERTGVAQLQLNKSINSMQQNWDLGEKLMQPSYRNRSQAAWSLHQLVRKALVLVHKHIKNMRWQGLLKQTQTICWCWQMPCPSGTGISLATNAWLPNWTQS